MGNTPSTEAGAFRQQPETVSADEKKSVGSCASTSMNLFRRSATGPQGQKREQELSLADAGTESRPMGKGDVEAECGLFGSIKSVFETITTPTESAVTGDTMARTITPRSSVRPRSELLLSVHLRLGFASVVLRSEAQPNLGWEPRKSRLNSKKI